LFVRDNRRVNLTRAGEKFLSHAQGLVNQWQLARQTLVADSQQLQGELQLYCSVTASYSFLYDLLDNFRGQHPLVDIKLNTGDPELGIKCVQQGTADIAIAALPNKLPRDVSFSPITTTTLRLIGPAGSQAEFYRNAKRFWAETAMVMPMAGYSQRLVKQWLEKTGLHPRIYARVAGNEAIVSMVSLGFGVGIVPEIVLLNSPLQERIEILEHPADIGTLEVGLFALNKRLRDPLVEAFWKAQ
jgi:LysR family positive regulator for ilvC